MLKKLAYGLMTIGLLGVVFLAIFVEAKIKTSTYLFIMSVGVAVTAAGIFGGQMLLNEVEYRERKRK